MQGAPRNGNVGLADVGPAQLVPAAADMDATAGLVVSCGGGRRRRGRLGAGGGGACAARLRVCMACSLSRGAVRATKHGRRVVVAAGVGGVWLGELGVGRLSGGGELGWLEAASVGWGAGVAGEVRVTQSGWSMWSRRAVRRCCASVMTARSAASVRACPGLNQRGMTMGCVVARVTRPCCSSSVVKSCCVPRETWYCIRLWPSSSQA